MAGRPVHIYPRVPYRTRLAYHAAYTHPPVGAFQDWELDALIDRARAIAEGHAVALFRLRLVPSNGTRGTYGDKPRASTLMRSFTNAQGRLRRLWAERCRRDGVEYDARVSRGDDR